MNAVPVELWDDDEFKAEWHNRIASMAEFLKRETAEIIKSIWVYKTK